MESTTKNFGDLQEGDRIMGSGGTPVTVMRVHEKHVPNRMFHMEFEDGRSLDVSGNHLWYVESSLDRSLHNERVRQGERLLRNMRPEVKVDLLQIAHWDVEKDGPIETELFDMVNVVEAQDNPEFTRAMVRIADSIGHIMEETKELQDMSTGETLRRQENRIYDARRFARQVLALSNERYRRKWPVVVGQVVTTEQIIGLQDLDLDFPEVKPLGEPSSKAIRGRRALQGA